MNQHTINRLCYITTVSVGDVWTATVVFAGTVIANVTGHASEATVIAAAANELRDLAGDLDKLAGKVARRSRS